MTTIITREVGATAKGSPLTNAEVDNNFTNLNADKLELGGTYSGGTANGVAYLNGSKVLTTGSALTFNGTNLTNSGTYPALYLNDTTPVNGFNFALSNGGLYWQYAEIGIYDVTSSQKAYAYAGGASGYHRWYQNGSEQMRLTSTGLGIGTSSPSYKLDVNGAINYGSGTLQYTGGSVPFGNNNLTLFSAAGNIGLASQYASINFPVAYATADSNGAWWMLGRSSGGDDLFSLRLRCGGAANDRAAYFVTSTGVATAKTINSHIWYTGTNTERMRIDSSGNLGLGVTPSAWRSSADRTIQVRGAAFSGYNNYSASITNNAYLNASSSWTYIESGVNPNKFGLDNGGGFSWNIAPSGTAGNAISFTQAMTLDASGNLGVGTTSPGARFHVYDGSGATRVVKVDGTGAPSVAWLSSGTERGIIGQANGVISGAATTDFAVGSTNALLFGSGGATERMRIDSSGNVLVGKTSDNETLVGFRVAANGTSEFTNTDSGTQYPIAFYRAGNASAVGSISTTSTTTTYATSSDYRLKENITPMANALSVVQQLNPVTYTWKADGSDGQGFIAHELQAVVPDCVTGEKDAVDAEGNPVYQGIDTSFLVATLTKAIQEQQELINQLTARVAQLEGN